MVIVEFSLAQKAFHVQTLKEMVINNLMNVLQRKQTDYVPIAFFETYEEVDKFIQENNEKIKDYTLYKSLNGEMLVK